MTKRYPRRSTRPIEDLPSLFSDAHAEESFELFDHNDSANIPQSDLEAMHVADDFTHRPPALRFLSFGSGSSGNCSYVGCDDCGILIDAGCDNNYVTEQLLRHGIDISTIHGILLTHDHADHVRFAYALLRRNHNMRLFTTPRTLEGLLRRHNISRRIKEYHSPIFKEHEYHFGPMVVTPFETSHDGTDNVGFHITLGHATIVIATDMGMITDRADFYIRRAHALMIEANYDSHMLDIGRYPEYLKRRIRSERGHMDNAVTARYLAQIHTPHLSKIFLCHLSHDNNTPSTALDCVCDTLRAHDITIAPSSAEITQGSVFVTALPRYTVSDLYEVT